MSNPRIGLHHSDCQQYDHRLSWGVVATPETSGIKPGERRKEIDPAYRRQLNVFHLGWQLLRRLISCVVPPACTLQFRPFRPDPVWYGKC